MQSDEPRGESKESEMVERVARALVQNLERNGGPPWDWYDKKGRERFYEAARDALAAMREPTEEMVAAACDYDNDLKRGDARMIFSAMIDVALGNRGPHG